MKKKLVAAFLMVSTFVLAACGNSNGGSETTVETPVVISSEALESTEESTTEESSEEVSVEASEESSTEESKVEESAPAEPTDVETERIDLGDIDGNGVEEYIVKELSNDGYWNVEDALRWTMYFNEEEIYQGYHFLNCNYEAEFVDLDQNGIEEVLIYIYPYVNSMPLEEFVVLKTSDDGWKELENTTELNGNSDDNAFPVQVLYGENKGNFDLIIEERNGVEVERITYDVTKHYQDFLDNSNDSFLSKLAEDILKNDKYTTGDVVGATAAWGIWELRVEQEEGVNYLVATHEIFGLEGSKYDDLGTLDVYFNYDAQGKIHVEKAEFIPYEG